jgi:N-acetylglucosamine-6-sulfatase
LNALDNHKVASNTVVIFISDNGMMWGEHRLLSKNVVYEESTRVPFAIRYPKFPGGIVRPEVVANIDIAPTILELAGIQSPWKMDGVSLVPLLTNAAASSGTASHWRPGIVLEGWLSKFQRVPFNAFHTDQFVYVENNGGDKELYDLKIDPGQNTNLIGRSRTYLEIETQMAKMLREAGVVPIATVREKRRDGKRAPRQVPSCRRCRPED